MKVADFFCGGGGFSEGFRQAGFKIVFAVDKWLPAVKTYQANKPGANVIQDDIIRIANLPDEEFDTLIPDTEIIIGSPPCQSFSYSNKSGNADKSIGVMLIEAYLKIIARKKFKKGSILKYWILENVPAVEGYIKEEYTAADFNLTGDFVLHTKGLNAGRYNAKYFGAPTNRERYLCGDFPQLQATHNDSNVVTLGRVLESLEKPLNCSTNEIEDINYPGLRLNYEDITDNDYIYEVAEFEWRTAKRLKQDRGYMGKMSFPENLDKPARTVMATMTTSSREAMILSYGINHYRLPTVRESACMMSFPIDYWFCGKSIGIKHTLVGNAVPPKLSYAIAVAIAREEKLQIPNIYPKISHDYVENFYNLNGKHFEIKKEKRRRIVSKFKYHVPYLIIDAYRVELTNYNSNFEQKRFVWTAEIHYSQGKNKADKFTPMVTSSLIPTSYKVEVSNFLRSLRKYSYGANGFQTIYCMTSEERKEQKLVGPYELLDKIKKFIVDILPKNIWNKLVPVFYSDRVLNIPMAIVLSYYVLKEFTENNLKSGGDDNGCSDA